MAPQRRPRRFGLVIPRGGENWLVILRAVGRFGLAVRGRRDSSWRLGGKDRAPGLLRFA